MIKYTFILLTFILVTGPVNAQHFNSIEDMSDTLHKLSLLVQSGSTDEIKKKANDQMMNYLEDALGFKNSIDYPFDEIKNVIKLCSEDKKVRLYTWSIAKMDYSFEYYGFLQTWNTTKERYELFELTDASKRLKNPENSYLSPDNWYGAVYYKIIQTKGSNKNYYTLLGWNGQNRYTNMKLIDVLTIGKTGRAKFGFNLFVGRVIDGKKTKTEKRVLFKYSAESTMLLDYDRQKVAFDKPNSKKNTTKVASLYGWNKSTNKKNFKALSKEMNKQPKKKVKTINLILFERIMPVDTRMKGMAEFYYSEPYFIDGFTWINGRWRFVKNVKARNEENINDNPNRPKFIDYDLAPPKKEKKKEESK